MCGSCRGVDALSEDEIEDAQHSGQPVTELSGRGAAERNPGLEDPSLGTDDPLLHRRGLDEEPGGHLGGGQPREEAQDEHDAFVLDAQAGEVPGAHLIGADEIDGAVLRRGHQRAAARSPPRRWR